MTPVVQVHELRKSYRSSPFSRPKVALDGVDFAVGEGECFGYLGQNGAGKTTTIKVLTGQIRADSGAATIQGRSGADPAARAALGYLPENPYFHEHLDPVEGLLLYGRLSGCDRETIRRRTAELLERVGLADAKHRRLRQFSKGMRQRFGLAAALIGAPEVLVLDEPLSGLDPLGRRLVKDLIRAERAAGRTILLSSHVLPDVQELCDRIVVLHHGRVIQGGRVQELLSHGGRMELRAEGVPAMTAEAVGRQAEQFQAAGGRLQAVLPDAELASSLAAEIHRAGGRILSLVPVAESLEEWFVRATEEVRTVPAPAAETVGALS